MCLVFLHVLVCPQSFTITISGSHTNEEMNEGLSKTIPSFVRKESMPSLSVFVGKNVSDQVMLIGDIAVPYGLQNADPCTARSCLWPKAKDGNVYVPYRISNQYSQREKCIIKKGLKSFAKCTCVRFIPANCKRQRNFLDIKSDKGCYSYLGRQEGPQVVSLEREGCVYQSTIQHELLHALGFKHEQSRSDRDLHVRILLRNVDPQRYGSLRKVNTNNLGTPYDYNSVMHYGRYAFSRNGQPTIVPIPNPNVCIGRATEMSANDILRVNRLYKCGMFLQWVESI
uniref:Metalloendopeptidase n=1 Tax=Neogobius melanostomus TaxID=47308 RepID=A0A8C6S5H9_9GOBI